MVCQAIFQMAHKLKVPFANNHIVRICVAISELSLNLRQLACLATCTCTGLVTLSAPLLEVAKLVPGYKIEKDICTIEIYLHACTIDIL